MSNLNESVGRSAVSVPVWSAARIVRKFEVVESPLDGEQYKRIATTGSSATDPADDLTNYIGWTFRRAPTISSFSQRLTATAANVYALGATRTTPTISASSRTLLVNATGRGSFGYLGVAASIVVNVRLEIIIDGRTVFDQTLNFPAAASQAITILGTSIPSPAGVPENVAWFDAMPWEFRRSLAVYVTPTAAMNSGNSVFANMLKAIA